jgi:hypothetical protein
MKTLGLIGGMSRESTLPYYRIVNERVREPSRAAYRAIIAALVDRGAQGAILDCTEIGLLIGAGDAPVPLFEQCSGARRPGARHPRQGAPPGSALDGVSPWSPAPEGRTGSRHSAREERSPLPAGCPGRPHGAGLHGAIPGK